jgi:hypothetical protein
LGIYSTSLGLLDAVSRHPDVQRVRVLANSGIAGHLPQNNRVEVESHDYAATGTLGRMWWEQIGCYRGLVEKNDDWLFLPKGFASFVGRSPIRLAVYVHDIMAATFADRYPGSFSRAKQWYFAACYRASLRRSRVVFTNTEFTRGELERWAAKQRVRCPPIVVVGYGVAPSAGSDGENKEDRILVFVRKSPHKRTDLAIRYVERWRRERHYGGQLVAVGSMPDGLDLSDGDGWHHEERLSSAQYTDLVAKSRLVVHFSEYEGFGMPPLDAVLAGVCPVYSDLPPEREVMDGAGCPFINSSYDSFVQAMDRALSISPQQLRSWADALALRHDWRGVADRVVSALHRFA